MKSTSEDAFNKLDFNALINRWKKNKLYKPPSINIK